MNRNRLDFIRKTTVFIDILLLTVSYLLAYIIRNTIFQDQYDRMQDFGKYLWILWIIVPFIMIAMNFFGVYSHKSRDKLYITTFKIFVAIALGTISIAAIFYFIGDNSFSRLFYGLYAVVSLALITLSKLIVKLFIKYFNKNKKHHKKVLVVGTQTLAKKFSQYVDDRTSLMIDIVGYIHVGTKNPPKDFKILGELDQLATILKINVIDEVVFALPQEYIGQIEKYVEECESMGITVNMMVNLYDLKLSKTQIGRIGDMPVLTFHTVSLDEWQLFLKRALDIFGALVGLFIMGIAFLFVAPIIYIESPGPIFFSQSRVGRNGRIFKCYKFRSMYMDAEERKKELMKHNEMKGAMFKMKNDPRITKVGKFIRKTSIDELPQFWNVLKGDMSLVGTRPPTLDEVEKYENYHWRRLSIKPGITGMWQVKGRSSIEDFEDIVSLDTEYIDKWSIVLDLKLILQTVQVVFAKNGAC